MTSATDPLSHWTRQVAVLRAQAVKRARNAPSDDLVDTVLQTCDALLQELAGAHLVNERLRAEVNAANDAWEHLFSVVPAACLLTDAIGTVLSANRPAGALLNVSAKHLKGRQLILFSEDRQAFGTLLQRVARGDEDEIRATLALRPKERRPRDVDVVVVSTPVERSTLWLWFMMEDRELQRTADLDIPAAVRSIAS